jgi:hypothetical protein
MGIELQDQPVKRQPVKTIRAPRGLRSAPAGRGLPMERGLCWGSLGVAALLLLLFVLDLFTGFPFEKASVALDIFAILASGIVVYLCIDTLREIK